MSILKKVKMYLSYDPGFVFLDKYIQNVTSYQREAYITMFFLVYKEQWLKCKHKHRISRDE